MLNAGNSENNEQFGAPTKLSKGQRYRRNRAARAAAAAANGISSSSLSNQPNTFGRGLPPKPVNADQQRPRKSKRHEAPPFVRKKQIQPSSFLKLPADILAQIVPYILPVDLFSLAQVNISVRRILMSRFASHMWRACITNAGLAACPPEISEPRYVFVLYLQLCSSCGKKEQRSPDTYLYVRLCKPCRELLLVDSRAIEPPEIQSLVIASNKSCDRLSGLEHSLKADVQATATQFFELKASNDEDALQLWTQNRKADLERRIAYEDVVCKSIERARRDQLDELKRKWREGVQNKLLKLGWTTTETDLPLGKRSKWRSFFEQTNVLTEERWNRLESRIKCFLDEEARDRPERERKERHTMRNRKLSCLFESVRFVKDTLPRTLSGDPLSLDDLSVMDTTTKYLDWLPPPMYDDALEWPVIRGLLETDQSVEEMTTQFQGHCEEITQLVVDWGVRFKKEMARILREGRQQNGLTSSPPRPRLPGSGVELDPFENVDEEMCLLLRADSLFQFEDDAFNLRSYDILIPAMHMDDLGPADLTDYSFHLEGFTIARALLAVLGCPDASATEFNSGASEWFKCGRCCSQRMSWLHMVLHYLREARDWEKAKAKLSTFAELGITFNYTHDLQSDSPVPLLKQLSAREISANDAKYTRYKKTAWILQAMEESGESPTTQAQNTVAIVEGANSENNNDEASSEDHELYLELPDRDRFACKLCQKGGLGSELYVYWDIDNLFHHLRNTHDISDPHQGLVWDDPKSIQYNPYFRLCERFEGLVLSWGVY